MLLFFWVFMILGLVTFSIGVCMAVKSIRSNYWPTTQGVIESAASHLNPNGKGGGTYSVEIIYTYQIAGVDYTGNKIAIGQMSASSQYTQGILDRYPIGRKVSVSYSPGDPSEAVLETGIHGGTWICLGVGTAFTLFSIMFLQVTRATIQTQSSGRSDPSASLLPDGRVKLNKPPILMGVIFFLAGSFIPFAQPASGMPHWILYATGGLFIFGGITLLLVRLENKIYAKTVGASGLLLFLLIFNWVSFGPGDRIGTFSTPFATHNGINVKTGFGVFTVFIDLIMLMGIIGKLLKWRKD